MTFLEVREVTMRYGKQRDSTLALDNATLSVNKGEFVTILGPSGCGKSTLLHIVGGFVRPTEGDVRLEGQAVVSPGRDRGMVFQTASLFPWRSVVENVAWPREIMGDSRREARRYALELLQRVGVEGFADKYPSQLSGGMRQRAAIARTLAMEPHVLLMDEPFGALDAQTREFMQEDLSSMCAEHGLTALFVTHDVSEAAFLGHRVLIMGSRPGRIITEVEVALDYPRTPVVRTSQAFLDAQKALRDLVRQQWSGVVQPVDLEPPPGGTDEFEPPGGNDHRDVTG